LTPANEQSAVGWAGWLRGGTCSKRGTFPTPTSPPLLGRGGVLLNGDHQAFGPALPTLDLLSQRVLDRQWTDDAFAERGIETAEQWWDSLASDPSFASLLAERKAARTVRSSIGSPPSSSCRTRAGT
jgi:hypothetical protein